MGASSTTGSTNKVDKITDDSTSISTAHAKIHDGADGDQLLNEQVGDSGGFFTGDIAGESRGDAEIVLKQNTKYLFRLGSNAAGNRTTIRFEWYE